MKNISFIVSIFIALIFMTSCENGNVTKLKREVKLLNSMCPISAGISGDFLSVKYNEKDGNVYMYFAINEQFGSQLYLNENRANVLTNLKLMFQRDNAREMVNDIVNAKAGLVITYKMPSNGKTVRFDIPYEELRMIKDSPMSEHDMNMIIIQNKIVIENNSCPYEIEMGIQVVKIAMVNDNIVWYYQVDEDMYNFKELKNTSAEIRSNIEATFKEFRRDPTFQSEMSIMCNEGIGYHFRYFANNSKDYFDIIFSSDELRKNLVK